MKIQDILAISTLGLFGGKKQKEKKVNVDCCPKCGSRRIQMKKGGKMRCMDCGKVSYRIIEIFVETKE